MIIAFAGGAWIGYHKGYSAAQIKGVAEYAEAQTVWRDKLTSHFSIKQSAMKEQRDKAIALAERLKNIKPVIEYRNVKTPNCTDLGIEFVRLFNDAREMP